MSIVSQTVFPGGPQAISEEKAQQTLNEWKIHPYMSVLKLASLVDLQQKVGELVLSITSRPSTIILENTLHFGTEKKCGYGNFDHRYNVSHIHLYALLGVCGIL
jgi:hypothetical protein